MERLTRLRLPLAVAALVALSLVVLARVGLGLSELGPGGSRAVAAARLAPNGSDATLTLLAGLLVLSCFVGAQVPGRRRLAGWGLVLVAVSLVASVAALALTDLAVAGWNLVWSLPDLVVPVLVGITLVAVVRPEPESLPVPVEEPLPAADAPQPDPERQPAWPGDAATGAVWRTAGEAASGAPALGWGSDAAGSSPWALPATPALPPGRDDRPDTPSPG